MSEAKNIVGITVHGDNKSLDLFGSDILHPFVSDGCSDYPNGTEENPTLWLDCCIEHDSKYWLGGTADEKEIADEGLYACVKSTGQPWRALAMYLAVRTAGGPDRETDYRWGYGWTRLRGYRYLSDSEFQMATAMYGDHLEGVEELVRTRKALVPEPANHTYRPQLDYNFCEEQVLMYLNQRLKTTATIAAEGFYESALHEHALIHLDICSLAIDLTFNDETTASTCAHDYLYSPTVNKIIDAQIPSQCKDKFLP